MIDKGQWREFGQDTGVTPLLFTRSAMEFLMTTESQDLGLTRPHPKDGALDSYSVPHPGWGLPCRYRPGSTLLSSVGNRSWAAG